MDRKMSPGSYLKRNGPKLLMKGQTCDGRINSSSNALLQPANSISLPSPRITLDSATGLTRSKCARSLHSVDPYKILGLELGLRRPRVLTSA